MVPAPSDLGVDGISEMGGRNGRNAHVAIVARGEVVLRLGKVAVGVVEKTTAS